MRGRAQAQTPEIVAAHKRVAAAKLCATSIYAAIPSGVMLLFLGAAAFIGALVAIGTGIAGLIRLQAVGMGPPLNPEIKGIERVSIRMAKRAKPQAGTGIAVGVLIVAFFGFQFFVAQKEAERRRGAMDDWMRQMRNLDDEGGDDTLTPEEERLLEDAIRDQLERMKRENAPAPGGR